MNSTKILIASLLLATFLASAAVYAGFCFVIVEVVDQKTGAPVPGATVTMDCLSAGYPAETAVTNSQGFARFSAAVANGEIWVMTIVHPSYQSFSSNVSPICGEPIIPPMEPNCMENEEECEDP
jgi:hypothetical protein